jgi:hypothetical protein
MNENFGFNPNKKGVFIPYRQELGGQAFIPKPIPTCNKPKLYLS